MVELEMVGGGAEGAGGERKGVCDREGREGKGGRRGKRNRGNKATYIGRVG